MNPVKKKIFSQNEDFRYMALYGWQDCLGGEESVAYGYMQGYKTASDELINYAHEFGKQDILVYPIMFSYRQYLELSLKYVFFLLYGKNKTEVLIKGNNAHSLNKVWNEIKTDDYIINHLPQNDIDFISDIVLFFSDIDDSSMNFRFFWDRDVNLSIDLKDELRINLEELKFAVSKFDDIISRHIENLLSKQQTNNLYLEV